MRRVLFLADFSEKLGGVGRAEWKLGTASQPPEAGTQFAADSDESIADDLGSHFEVVGDVAGSRTLDEAGDSDVAVHRVVRIGDVDEFGESTPVATTEESPRVVFLHRR